MKPEEAIETIKVAISEVEWDYPMDYTVAFEEAIKALEKTNKRRIFMSKYEQAIKLLEMLSSDEFQQFTSSEFDDAIYTAIEALEKQIPKKPVDDPENGWFECPNCGSIVWVYYGSGETHHCECGQALDLEEIE